MTKPIHAENDFGLHTTAPRCIQCGWPRHNHSVLCNTTEAQQQRAHQDKSKAPVR